MQEYAESEKATKLKDFEKLCKTMKLEKEDMARDLTESQVSNYNLNNIKVTPSFINLLR